MFTPFLNSIYKSIKRLYVLYTGRKILTKKFLTGKIFINLSLHAHKEVVRDFTPLKLRQ